MAIIIITTTEADEEEKAAKQEKRKKIRYNIYIYDRRKIKKERSRKRVRPML
jgi:hypothetical protein